MWQFLRKNKSHITAVSILIVIAFLTLSKILFTKGLIMHGDVKFPWEMNNFIQSGRYLFSDHFGNVSGIEVMSRWNSMSLIAEILNFFGFGTEILVKTLFFIGLNYSLLSFYIFSTFFLKDILKKKAALLPQILVTLVFAYNPWILNQIQAWSFWVSYSSIPLIMMFFYKFLSTKKNIYIVLVAYFLSIISAGPQFLFFVLLSLVAIMMTFILSSGISELKSIIPGLFKGMIVFIFLSLPWILTISGIFLNGLRFTTGYGYGTTEVSSELLKTFSKKSFLMNIFTGYDQWMLWFKGDISSVFQQILSFVPLILMLTGTIVNPKLNKSKKTFLTTIFILFLIFSTLAMGSNLYGYENFVTSPIIANTIGFVFRVPSKFSFFVFIAYSSFILTLFAFVKSKTIKYLIYIVIIAYLFFVCFVRAREYYFCSYLPTQKPNFYVETYLFLEEIEDDLDSRILWFAPYEQGYGKNSLNWESSFIWNQNQNAQHTPETSSKFVNISWYHLTFKSWLPLFEKINKKIDEDDLKDLGGNLLNEYSVKYLVYHNDIIGAEEYGAKEINKIIEFSDLILLKNIDDKIFIFENKSYKPLIENCYQDEKGIEYKKISPVEYKISWPDGKKGKLCFLNIFDPYWVLEADGKKIFPDKNVDTGTMVFDIKEEDVNDVSIKYLPDKYYKSGLKISGILFVLLSLSLCFFPLKSKIKMIIFYKGRNEIKERK